MTPCSSSAPTATWPGTSKTHLFGAESSLFAAGDALACVEADGVLIAPMICFDVEMAEFARTLAAQEPDVFIAIAANNAAVS